VIEELSQKDITTLVPAARPDPDAPQLTLEEQQAAMTWGPDRILPVLAYNYFAMATKDDPDLALEGTLDAISKQRDSGIRKGMATGFVTVHPDMKSALYAGLSQNHLDIPDVKPAGEPANDPEPTQNNNHWSPIASAANGALSN
jgi:hypothetical protein